MRNATITPKSIRRLLAADGYMDLDMPERAIEELKKIGDAGPLAGPYHLLMGLAHKRCDWLEDAVRHLELAARKMPKPVRRFAWQELVSCYRGLGSEDLAEMAESLGGDQEFELRIALPGGELNICSSESAEVF